MATIDVAIAKGEATTTLMEVNSTRMNRMAWLIASPMAPTSKKPLKPMGDRRNLGDRPGHALRREH